MRLSIGTDYQERLVVRKISEAGGHLLYRLVTTVVGLVASASALRIQATN